MRLIRLILINIKRQLKNPAVILTTVVVPIVMLLAMNSGNFDQNAPSDFGIIDKSNSKYSAELISGLKEDYEVQDLENSAEDNYDKLRENKLGAIYVIGEDFEKELSEGAVPNIKCYKTEDASGMIVADNYIKEYVADILEEQVSSGLSTNYIKAEIIQKENSEEKDAYKMTIVMIIYFTMIGSTTISVEMIKLKSEKVLRRSISTSNKDSVILGSLFLSSFILQGVLSTISYIVLTFILKLPVNKIPEGILLLFLGSLITIAIIIVITRWIKNASIASLVTVLSSLVLFGLGVISDTLDTFKNIPSIVTKISILSPFTWILKMINTGEYLVSIIIILLMSAVCFTCGSFRLREYVKE